MTHQKLTEPTINIARIANALGIKPGETYTLEALADRAEEQTIDYAALKQACAALIKVASGPTALVGVAAGRPLGALLRQHLRAVERAMNPVKVAVATPEETAAIEQEGASDV